MADPQRWGIDVGYADAAGVWREATSATVSQFLEAMGAATDGPSPGQAFITSPLAEPSVVSSGQLLLEDGGTVRVDGRLPPDVPFGYHRHLGDDGVTTAVIASPGRCWLPHRLRTWGWAIQLYAARSTSSWGVGDLADLRRLSAWSAGQGAGMALINPLHAPMPAEPQQPSPYFASSRCFRNPLYLRIEALPGAERLPHLDRLTEAGRALNAERRVDRDAVWRLKSAALEDLYASFQTDPRFERYVAEQGEGLRGYSVFCALGDRYGFSWHAWPSEVRRPDGPGIAPFAASREGGARIRYHSWVQWLLDRQLEEAAQPLGLVQDIAIGADAHGADAWRWQGCLALGVRVGAPPDEFNTSGQDWGLPPFDPWRLRTAGYRPFIELVRAGLRHAAGIRFDHVMGLSRLFWIPPGGTPAEGTYVRYPVDDLLDILALESHRAAAYIVGEDLGTVEPGFRSELRQRGVLSYRLLWFEPDAPGSGHWPQQALGAVTTHDLPTVAGLWSGRDLEVQRSLGLHPNERATEAIRQRLSHWTGLDDSGEVSDVVEGAYRLLAQAPCAILAATLEDALAVEERPNMPGTTDEWPNWSLALPRPVEALEASPLARRIAAVLNERDVAPSRST